MRASTHTSLCAAALLAVLLPILSGAPALRGGEAAWPQWRGPERNGVAESSPTLAPSWPEGGPPCVWKIDGIPSGGEGGYGSPVVARDRVYLYVHWRYRVPLVTRVLTGEALRRLGSVPEGFPRELLKDLERARSSPERTALRGRDLEEWANAWVDARLDEEGRRRLGSFVSSRLHQGEEAIPLSALERLEAIRDRTFASAGELESWLDVNGLSGPPRMRILEAIPVEERRTKDVVLSLDAGSGREIWRRESPGSGEGASSTLCVWGGRCYGLGSTGEAFSLDARTGREIWRARLGGGHSSFLLDEGRAVVLSDPLAALDASSGEVVWTQKEVRGHESSVVPWRWGGSTYLMANAREKVACVALSDGAVRWTVQGGGPSTPAVAGDLMAILTDKEDVGLLAYRIAPEGAEKLWGIPDLTDRGASPVVHEGRVYAVASDRTVCVDARTGKILWEGKPGRGDICSPILAGGKLIASLGGRSLAMMRSGGEAFELLGEARLPLAQCSSPALVGGRLYARLQDGLACYDLAAPPAAPMAPKHAAAGTMAEARAEAGSETVAWDIPLLDLDSKAEHHVVVDREKGQYLGHPSTCLLEDGKTILCVYPKGHGRGAVVYKRSRDGGRTWSERLPTPESWATSMETPTIHRVVDGAGKRRVILWSGLYPARLAVSEDDGETWSELAPAGKWGGIVVMGCLAALRTGGGHYLAMFHDDGRFFAEGGKATGAFRLYRTLSTDGGLTWRIPEPVFESRDVHLCEPGLVRSPDGKRLAVLLRENRRVKNSHIAFSSDEGNTWTEPREMPDPLNGDRHTGAYAPDGRLLISFRDRPPAGKRSPTEGDWVGWVGTYEDLVAGRPGQYRVRLKDNRKGADCAYPGVEVLPDGTFVATTYGHWEPGEEPYILCVRFRLEDLDRIARRSK
jgi:hypothetical protein